jgi:hypothetical protein
LTVDNERQRREAVYPQKDIVMSNDSIPSLEDSEEERVRRAEELLAQCTNPKANTDGWLPAWASSCLDHSIKTILDLPGSESTVPIKGLWNLLTHTQAPLTEAMTEFQRAIRISTLIRHRTLFDADFSWMVNALKKRDCTAAQAYLSLSFLQEEHLALCKTEILEALKDSKREYFEQAFHQDGIRPPDVMPYGHYQIHTIEVNLVVANGVIYSEDGTYLGVILYDVKDGIMDNRVHEIKPPIPAPTHWKMLVQKYLGDEI